MRANVEDTDLSSSKLRLAAAYIDDAGVKLSTEDAVLGAMVRIWYFAVNEKKPCVTLDDLSTYLFIVNHETISSLASCLVRAGYLKRMEDGTFGIIGKDKDFLQKKNGEELARTANEVRHLKAMTKLKKEAADISPQAPQEKHPQTVPHKGPSTVPSTDPSTEPPKVPPTDPHTYHTMHSDHSLQTTQSKTQSPSAPLAPAARSSSETVLEVEDFYRDLQSKLNLPEDGTPLPVIEPAPCVASEVKGISWIKPGETTPTKVDKSNYQSFVHDYYQALWKKRMKSDKWPGFSGRDFALCKEIMKQLTFDIERFCRLMDLYFSWQLPEVIEAGFPFSKGYASFHHKLTELMADEVNAARRAEAVIAKGNMKLNEAKVREEERARRILGGKKDGDGSTPSLPA